MSKSLRRLRRSELPVDTTTLAQFLIGKTLVCADASGVPVCAPTASPPDPMKGQTAVISANCSHQPASYTWTGGDCTSSTGPMCTMTKKRKSRVQITVSATNGSGTGPPAAITVQWR